MPQLTTPAPTGAPAAAPAAAPAPSAPLAAYPPPPPPPPPPASSAYAPDSPVAPRPRRGRLLAGGLVAALALGAGGAALAARGGTGPVASPLAAAAANTQAATTARVELTVTGGGLPGELRAAGAVDFATNASHLEIDLAALAGLAGEHNLGDGRIEVVTQNGAAYLKTAFLAELTGSGPQWVKIDAAQLAAHSGGPLPTVPHLDIADPQAILALLREHADSVTPGGPEVLDGVTTTRSTATFDLARLASEHGGSRSSEDLAGLFGRLGDTVITVDVWVGADDVIRQAVARVPSAEGEITVSFRLRAVGEPVTVEVPAASDVFDVTRLLSR